MEDRHDGVEHLRRYLLVEVEVVIKRYQWISLGALHGGRGGRRIEDHVDKVLDFLLIGHAVLVLEDLSFLLLVEAFFLLCLGVVTHGGEFLFGGLRRDLALEGDVGEDNADVLLGDESVSVEIVPKYG